MKQITVDCTSLDKAGLHLALKTALDFPHWYGNNLDALYDCLTEISEPTQLTLLHFPELTGFRETFADAASVNESLILTILSE